MDERATPAILKRVQVARNRAVDVAGTAVSPGDTVFGVQDSSGAGWQGRRVLVTGGDGFIGSHLTERLLGLGAQVGVLVRPSSTRGTATVALRNLSKVRERLAAVLAVDVAGPDAVDRICDFGADVVFHLAADAWVERSFAQPQEVLRTNLGGTMNVLQAARRRAVERVVITSSSEVYGPAQQPRIDEHHPLEPTSPYAASKVAADRMAMAYHGTWNLPIAVIRPFNTYGPRHVYDVIPKFIRWALRGEPILVFGDGRQSRDFTYVDDMVDAFLAVGAHPDAIGRTLHFGSGEATQIVDLARLIRDLAQSDAPIVHVERRPAEVARLCCDPTEALRCLGWKPSVDLTEGLRRNIAWARAAGWSSDELA